MSIYINHVFNKPCTTCSMTDTLPQATTFDYDDVFRSVNDDDDSIVISASGIDIGNDSILTTGTLKADSVDLVNSGTISLHGDGNGSLHVVTDPTIAYGSISTTHNEGPYIAAAGQVGGDDISLTLNASGKKVHLGSSDGQALNVRFGGADNGVTPTPDSTVVASLSSTGLVVNDVAGVAPSAPGAMNFVYFNTASRGVLFPEVVSLPGWTASYEGMIVFALDTKTLSYANASTWVAMHTV